MKNIILTGFMGTGKTSVCVILAEKTGFELIDTDKYIEDEQKMSVNEIFNRFGEASFRMMETDFLEKRLPLMSHVIISCGGGMPISEKNRNLLGSNGTVYLLTARPEEIYRRLQDDSSRPLLKSDSPMDRIRELMHERESFYRAAADHVIATDGKTPNAIADEILRIHVLESR